MGSMNRYFKVTIKSRVLPTFNPTYSLAPKDGYEIEFQACCKTVIELICKQPCNPTAELTRCSSQAGGSVLFSCLSGHADCSPSWDASHRSTPGN